jgi:hypothetical protein
MNSGEVYGKVRGYRNGGHVLTKLNSSSLYNINCGRLLDLRVCKCCICPRFYLPQVC